MKQISTGTGLVGLGVCLVATAFIATQRGGEAFAQAGGGERRIVSAGVFQSGGTFTTAQRTYAGVYAYRIWSDNAVDLRCVGATLVIGQSEFHESFLFPPVPNNSPYDLADWKTVDDGTTTFLRSDVDRSRMVDAGDIGTVLLEFGAETGDPPPPIDCDINAPR